MTCRFRKEAIMEEWEIQERRWRMLTYAIGIFLGTVVMFLLLLFVARHSPERKQDKLSIICHHLMQEKSQGSGK